MSDFWHFSTSVPVLTPPVRAKREFALSADTKRLQSALDAIPNTGDKELEYEKWRDVAFAIHHATEGSDEGLELLLSFSARSSKFDEEFTLTRVWPYIGVNSSTPITERSLFALAEQHGWRDPAILDDFDIVPEEDFASGATVGKFSIVPAHEFASRKPPQWIVQDVLPQADLAVVFGESGSGKSFFVFDMVAAVARGVLWRNKKTKQGKVVYVVAEGAGGFQSRLRAYAAHESIDLADLPMGILGDAPNLLKLDDVKALTAAIQQFEGVEVVVLDTFAQVMPGGNENSGEDVGKALSHCKAIRKATGALIVLVHHSGKDSTRGARGWSGLRAAADAEIEISRVDDARVATTTKLKDGDDGQEYGFKLTTVPVGMNEDGDVISSCVIEHNEVLPRSQRKRAVKGANETLLMRVLEDMVGLGSDPWVDWSEHKEQCLEQMTYDASEGKRDRRGEVWERAFKSLQSANQVEVDGNRVRKAGG